jgi:hypothetical protein
MNRITDNLAFEEGRGRSIMLDFCAIVMELS